MADGSNPSIARVVKDVVKLLAAGAIGSVGVLATYRLLDVYKVDIDVGSDAAFLALLLWPFPVGLIVAVMVYRILNRLW
jgi:hypothetical protein